jgi:hypothetical protein
MILSLIIAIVRGLMRDPEMRSIIEGSLKTAAAEMILEFERNPAYKNAYEQLSAELKNPNLTVEQVQDVEKRIQALHRNPPQPISS